MIDDTQQIPPQIVSRSRPRIAAMLGQVWQPREPAFWILSTCVLACFPLSIRTALAQDPTPSLAMIGALALIIQGTALWLIAAWALRGRGLPRSWKITAMIWGFVVAPVIASAANTNWFAILSGLGVHSFAAAIAAPFDEDLLRFAGILAVLAVTSGSRRPSVVEGICIGFLVGAGFELSENLLFILSADDSHSGMQVTLIRTGLGFGLHALWSGIQGALLMIGLTRLRSRPLQGSVTLVAGVLLPMLLHSAWDAPSLVLDYRWTYAMLATIYVISIGALVGLVRFCASAYSSPE